LLTTGVDLVHIPRIQRAIERLGQRFLDRVYTPAEVSYCRGRAAELAVRFAAKEAVSKALGVGVRILNREGIYFHEVETLPDKLGKPHVVLHGRAAQRAKELGLSEWAISLSHDRETAVAFVVAR
jgi:holo-[acyl-carrier protein] synthase